MSKRLVNRRAADGRTNAKETRAPQGELSPEAKMDAEMRAAGHGIAADVYEKMKPHTCDE